MSLLSDISQLTLNVRADEFNLPSNPKATNKRPCSRPSPPSPPPLSLYGSPFELDIKLAEKTALAHSKDQPNEYYRRLSLNAETSSREDNKRFKVIDRPNQGKVETELYKSKAKTEGQFAKMIGDMKI